MKDRMDAVGVGWFDSLAQRREVCCVCKADLRKGTRILAERVLLGTNVKPHTMHRRCWPRHLDITEREANARKRQKALDTAPVEA